VTGEEVRRFVDELVREHVKGAADGQVMRAAARFGLIAAAGELATMFGLTPWQEGETTEAATGHAEEGVAPGVAGSEEERALVAEIVALRDGWLARFGDKQAPAADRLVFERESGHAKVLGLAGTGCPIRLLFN
jgi:hypothetical protein